MNGFAQRYVDSFMSGLIARNPGESEFHQAVGEVTGSVVSANSSTESSPTFRRLT